MNLFTRAVATQLLTFLAAAVVLTAVSESMNWYWIMHDRKGG